MSCLENKMQNHSVLKSTLYMESTINLKFIWPMSKESSKFLIGEILRSLNFTVWRMKVQASKDNLAELLSAPKDIKILSVPKTLSEASKPNFLMMFGGFISEMRSETSPHQRLSEMTTKTRLNLLWSQDSVFWVNGSRTGRLDTTCLQRISFIIREINISSTI